MIATPRPVVVHVMGWSSVQYGSFERQMVLLGRRLADAGAALHLVFRSVPSSPEFLADVPAAIHVLRGARGPWDLAYLLRCAGLLQRVGATHLHAHYGTDAYLAVAAGRLVGVERRFTTKHTTPGTSRLSASRLRHRLLARQVETWFAVSQRVAEVLADLGVPREVVRVHLMGVDAGRYRPDRHLRARTRRALGIGPGDRLVLATSHLRPGKGAERMPDLAAALAREPGGCLTAIAGDGPTEAAVAARARALGLGPAVFRMLGARDDVPALLAAADVFVLPTDGTEGFGASVVEALASGTPAVVTDVSDLRTLAGAVAEVVPRADTGALVAAARRVLTSPSRAAAMAEAGRTVAMEHLGVQRGVDQLLDTYLTPRPVTAGSPQP